MGGGETYREGENVNKVTFIAVELLFLVIVAAVGYAAVKTGEGPLVAVSATLCGAALGFVIGLVWKD